ncbi:hypothetical protein E4T73_00130 [Staphylococcus arlettae]|uniref:hypothetical protein n=1 Tax=Staphylococcus arlettae TaxID=29378 RepID=UPI0010718989|nr:hypothetical protein [Staphylococcus arlettae]MBF0736567.1 hypothetical protein [Staphylococcus arlettae]MBK3719145.1 hypothetical protein [Staphylococcus arlettae]TFU48696.1 hypothetical protein E4T73_00130 [Staphylococcus arlettae]
MLISIIINIIATVVILGIDLYRQNFKQLKYSSVLIALTINGLINLFIVGEYDYISFFTILLFLAWTLLQLYINRVVDVFVIKEQKFIAVVLTIILSTSTILTYSTSHDSYYMSIPYLAPAIALIGAIFLFYSTFQPEEQMHFKLINKIKRPILIGNLMLIMSFILMTLLTPYWYAFLIIYIVFIAFIYWQNIFSKQND